jgi:DNA-binding FrmR family transcriptional regulator
MATMDAVLPLPDAPDAPIASDCDERGTSEEHERSAGAERRGYTPDKDNYLKRLRRIEGQVRGLQRMIGEDAYCIDVLTQVSAVTKALQSVALGLLEEHLGHCVGHAMNNGEDAMEAKVKEAAEAIARLVRS